MNPEFAHLVEVFGSQAEVARTAGVLQSTVSMWKRRGLPDAWRWRLLREARRRGLPLDAAKLGLADPARGAA